SYAGIARRKTRLNALAPPRQQGPILTTPNYYREERLERFRRCCRFRSFHLAFWLLLSFARDALVHLNAIGRSVAAVSERPGPAVCGTGRDLSQRRQPQNGRHDHFTNAGACRLVALNSVTCRARSRMGGPCDRRCRRPGSASRIFARGAPPGAIRKGY